MATCNGQVHLRGIGMESDGSVSLTDYGRAGVIEVAGPRSWFPGIGLP